MAAIDKMYCHSYYEYDELRKWAMVYYPELLFYFYDVALSYNDYKKNMSEWVEQYKKNIERNYARLGKFETKSQAVSNLQYHYMETAGYKCPLKQAKEEVDYCLKLYKKLQVGNYALEEDYTFPVMNTPFEVDLYLKWHCPIPYVRKYLEKQCGYKTKWYHKLFWRGKKHFNYGKI